MKRRSPEPRSPPPTPPAPASAEPITQRELVLLAVIVLVGAALRLVALSHSAVEHFDEGVYASNLYFGAPDFAYPQQSLYAPPLLPALIEAGMIAGVPPNVAALLPGFLAGCGTIAALWWFGRSWFGPAVGLAAATLAALSDFHVAYSAAALTDVLLGLWLVLAVDAIARALARDDFRWAIGAGLYTGLAWWTKYNGWLPLAIEAAALPLYWLITRRPILRKLGCFATTAAIAAAVWSPYYFSLQSSGGYGPIAANHAKYVVGLAGWLDSASRQIAAQHVMNGLLTGVSLGLSLTLVRWVVRKRSDSWLVALWEGGGTILMGLFLGFGITPLVLSAALAAIGILTGVRSVMRQRKIDSDGTRQAIALCLLGAWWLGLLVATPCYWPYPRLTLPLQLVGWLGTAVLFQQAAKVEDDATFLPPPQWVGLLVFVSLIVGLCVVGSQFPRSLDPASVQDRRGLQFIGEEIRRGLPAADKRAVYVQGEPAIFFQLAAVGEPLIVPVKDIPAAPATIDGRPIPTYLVVGPHTRRDPQFQRHWNAARVRWELIQSHDYEPSPIVWLDLHNPREPDPSNKEELNRVEVYRLQ